MSSEFWNTLTNMLLLVFWIRMWTPDGRLLSSNRNIRPLGLLSERLVAFLKPIFFGLPVSAFLGISLLFLLLFRGMLTGPATLWTLTIGLESYTCITEQLLSCLLFSVLSFFLFLFKQHTVRKYFPFFARVTAIVN